LKAGAYLEKGKPDKARKEIATCLEILPEYAEALLLRAQLNYQEGALEPALKDVDAAKSNFTAFSKFFTYTYQDYLDRLRDDRDRQETLSHTQHMGSCSPSSVHSYSLAHALH
ncbi:MAG: hypothetical protein HGA84_08040, partial [Syntrophobacteraceae bacterium]|nr:hypothetical protein [Syntrophobacteraceae bacterium]